MHFFHKGSVLFDNTFFCKRPVLIYLHARELFMFLFSSADFLQNQVFYKKPSEITIGVSSSLDLDQNRRSVGLHLGSTVCKGYWQMTKFSTRMQRVKTGKYFSVQYIIQYR